MPRYSAEVEVARARHRAGYVLLASELQLLDEALGGQHQHKSWSASDRRSDVRRGADRAALSAARSPPSGSLAATKAHDAAHGPSFAAEVAADPKGVGFAYGGVEPGNRPPPGSPRLPTRLDPRHGFGGQGGSSPSPTPLVKVHEVIYSVGRAGTYKLHVALRHQQRVLPGSPFLLHVVPGKASPRWTCIAPEALPLRLGKPGAYSVQLAAHDSVGNRCVLGGAPVALTCTSQPEELLVHCRAVDQKDGTYMLHWEVVAPPYAGSVERPAGGSSGSFMGWLTGSGAASEVTSESAAGEAEVVVVHESREVPAARHSAVAVAAAAGGTASQGGAAHRAALNVMLDGIHVLGSPYRMLRL